MIDPKAGGNTSRHVLAHRAVLESKPCQSSAMLSWAEAAIKIARMTLTIKLDRNWNSFQLANSTPPLSVTDSAIAPFPKDALPGRASKKESAALTRKNGCLARVFLGA